MQAVKSGLAQDYLIPKALLPATLFCGGCLGLGNGGGPAGCGGQSRNGVAGRQNLLANIFEDLSHAKPCAGCWASWKAGVHGLSKPTAQAVWCTNGSMMTDQRRV